MQVSFHLLVLRGFEEGVVGGAADHFVEGGAGGNHRVDAVFFFNGEVDEESLAAGARAGDDGDDVFALVDRGAPRCRERRRA